MIASLWLLPALAFTAAVASGFLGFRDFPQVLIRRMGWAFLAVEFLGSLLVAGEYLGSIPFDPVRSFGTRPWFSTGPLEISWSWYLDPLSLSLLLFLTGFGWLLFAPGSRLLQSDEGYFRFAAVFHFLLGTLQILMLSGNFLVMMMAWEGAALGAYFLLSHRYESDFANRSALQTYLFSMAGDTTLLLSLVILGCFFRSLSYDTIFTQLPATFSQGGLWPVLAGIFLVFAVVPKCGLLPLHAWVADEVEGSPTIAAFLQTGTMILAGVYLLLRVHPILSFASEALTLLTVLGGATAVFSAHIALVQTRLKQVLTLVTLTQVGIVAAGIGCGAFEQALFHFFASAFGITLTFLASVALGKALGAAPDLRKLGGLHRRLPVISWTFFAGAFTLSGIPPFVGFFSREPIFLKVFQAGHLVTWFFLLIASGLSALALFRSAFLIFAGKYRGSEASKSRIINPPVRETRALRWLTLVTLCGGVLGLPQLLGRYLHVEQIHLLSRWLAPVTAASREAVRQAVPLESFPLSVKIGLVALSLAFSLMGLRLAQTLFLNDVRAAEKWVFRLPGLYNLAFNQYWFEEFFQRIAVAARKLGKVLNRTEKSVLEGIPPALFFGARVLGLLGNIIDIGVIDGALHIGRLGGRIAKRKIQKAFSRLLRALRFKEETGHA